MTDLAVIIPCRNVAETLAEQLDALSAEQWDGQWEIVVVDNGSTDGTADVAAKYAEETDRIRVVEAPDGSGVAYVRNVGVRCTDAAAFAFCDGDDIIAPGWVGRMGDALRSAALVTGSHDVESLNTPALARSRGLGGASRLLRFGDVPVVRGNNCGFRREAYERLGGFDDSYRGLEDVELSIRAAALGLSVTFVPEACVRYRYRADARALWRQASFYGSSLPDLARRAREHGLRPPPRWSGVRSWAWLALHLPGLVRRDRRLAWIWVLGHRVGVLRGAVAARTLQI